MLFFESCYGNMDLFGKKRALLGIMRLAIGTVMSYSSDINAVVSIAEGSVRGHR